MRLRLRGEQIRKFVLENVENHPSDISNLTAEEFEISRQAVNKHLQKLTLAGALLKSGKTRNQSYKLAPLVKWSRGYSLANNLAEDVVWRNDVRPMLGAQPDNVIRIWNYSFTEIFNNAIDHSDGQRVLVFIVRTAIDSEILIYDDGVGIFEKIRSQIGLLDQRHAVLELSKGKLTTDPDHHTGEGIFFTSRMVDQFIIRSGGVFFGHQFETAEDWILENPEVVNGTNVRMKLINHTVRTVKQIFSQYTAGDGLAFNKTVVPVELAQYGDDQLVSRSQAKRLLARVDLFKVVVLDFSGVGMIGQAFADEVFRVFVRQHPEVEIIPVNTDEDIEIMISRVVQTTAGTFPIIPDSPTHS